MESRGGTGISTLRVLGIDPGTVSIDLCVLAEDRVFLDAAVPTRDSLADPTAFLDQIIAHGVEVYGLAQPGMEGSHHRFGVNSGPG